MTTTYTDNLRLAIQGLGDNNNTWGAIANNGVFERLEDAIAGMVSLNLTGNGDYTLSVANGAQDEARNMILRFGGTPGSPRNVIIPAASKLYVVECTVSASVSITIKANGGTGVSCQPGQKLMVYCDGLNTFKLTPELIDLGITASAGEINVLDGITATTAELNVLDGITVTTAELNLLDGVVVSAAQLNLLATTTVTVQDALNSINAVLTSAITLSQVSTVLTSSLGFNTFFNSGPLNWVINSVYEIPHNLGTTPFMGFFELICVSATSGYKVGDVVPWVTFAAANSGNRTAGYNSSVAFFKVGNNVSFATFGPKEPDGAFAYTKPEHWHIQIKLWV